MDETENTTPKETQPKRKPRVSLRTTIYEGVTEIKESVTDVKASVVEAKDSVAEIKESVADVKASVVEAKESVADIKESVTDVKESTTEVRESVTEIKESVTEVQQYLHNDVNDTAGTIRSDVADIKEMLLRREPPRYPKYDPYKESRAKHALVEIPKYLVKSAYRAKWFRTFLWLVLAAFVAVFLMLWRDLYNDNCLKQAEINRLELVETKYRTIKQWAESDKVWRRHFLIIDRCYSDTVYYRDDIEALKSHINKTEQKK